MLNGHKANRSNDPRPEDAVIDSVATGKGAPELLLYQEQLLRALAQGTPWPGGRMPLSFQPSPYRVRVKESSFFAGTALDCLQLPALLGETIQVETVCPTNGRAICLTVTGEGVANCDPPGCVLSLVTPGQMPGSPTASPDDRLKQARQLTHFFSSAEAAALWLVPYADVDILDLDQAWRLANGDADDRDRPVPVSPDKNIE